MEFIVSSRNVYFTSDMHFCHENILKFEPISRKRYKNIDDMDRRICKVWNSTVGSRDLVYVLGDIGMKHGQVIKAYMATLNGEKILIKGNHDKYSNTWYRDAGFATVLSGAIIYLTNNMRVKLSHFPYDDPPFEPFKEMPTREDMPLIHGHVHGKYTTNPVDRTINVSWDVWHRPVNRDEILNIIRRWDE